MFRVDLLFVCLMFVATLRAQPKGGNDGRTDNGDGRGRCAELPPFVVRGTEEVGATGLPKARGFFGGFQKIKILTKKFILAAF